MLTADQNFRLLQEIEENRRFLLMAYQQNPKLLENAETRIQQIVGMVTPPGHGNDQSSVLCVAVTAQAVGTTRPAPCGCSPQSSERGISLIELIMFIVIISVALAGILTVMNKVTGHSADTLIRKQALAIAESLLEEVELMPFTYCDPDDPTATTATSATVGAGACTARAEGLGLDVPFAPYQNTIETRYDPATPFDNVNDYNNFTMTAAGGIQDITGSTVLTGYDAVVTMTQPGLGGIAGAEMLLINVTVTGPDNEPVTLEGYRTRHSPNSVP